MRLEFKKLPTHPDLELGICFADWDRKAVNGNSVGMFIWISSNKGDPACQELLLRDGDHCIARFSVFHKTHSVLSRLCPDRLDDSVFIHLCINRLILRQEGNISVLVADEHGVRHHLGTIEFYENTFDTNEKPTIELGARPILISSLGRSGSTVLANSIGLHPEVCLIGRYPFEYRFFSYCLHATYILTSPANHDFSMGPDAIEKVNVFNTGFNPFNFRGFDRLLDNDDLRNFYETEFTRDTAAHFMQQAKTAIEKVISTKKNATAFIEKAVGTNLSNLAENIYPNMKEIVLLRGFWDMALSMIAFDAKRGTKSFYSENPDDWLIARAYQHCNLTIRSRMKGKIPVVYEDLIGNPELCLTELARKLDLSQDPESITSMLEPFRGSAYLEKHKTDKNKKQEIRKWFSEDAVRAAEILLSQCAENKDNTRFELATWTGDVNVKSAISDANNHPSKKRDLFTASLTEAFGWAAELENTRTRQNNILLKHEIATLEENYSAQILAHSKRATTSEQYCASLEVELEKHKKTLELERAFFKEKLASNNPELVNAQIAIHIKKTNQVEEYAKSLEDSLEKIRRQYQLESEHRAEEIDALTNNLNAVIQRAEHAEQYAKTLETERARLNDYIRNQDSIHHEKDVRYQAEIEGLKNNFACQILDYTQRASRAEVYCASLEIELEKLKQTLSFEKSNFLTKLEAEKQILAHLNRAKLAEEYAQSVENELKKNHIEWQSQVELHARELSSLSKNLQKLIERAERAEEYAKALESDRAQLNESYTNEHNLLIKNQNLYAKEIQAVIDRACRSEEYCKSLEIEICKLKDASRKNSKKN